MPLSWLQITKRLGYSAFTAVLFALSGNLYGQNLVPNPSFENFDICPPGIGSGNLNCIPWVNPTAGTSDYFNACNGGTVGVPNNFVGTQDAHTGVAYVGGYYYTGNMLSDYREYVQAHLTQPLIAGTTYDVSLWYSLGDNFSCPSNQLGIYLSVIAPSVPTTISVLNVTPQIQLSAGLITNTTSWLQLSGCFVAAGGEEYVTIGNFYVDAQTQADPGCANGGFTYLYIDDVSVIENGSLPGTINFDLGPNIEACDSVLLDPGLGALSYVWQDGSHDPTYTVTVSGTYYLTVTSGCDYGVDSIDVVITPSVPPVELGPDEINICPGEVIVFDLDPNAGSYVWQDNSTNPMYVITAPGIYAVTLDDGCGTSSDQVEVIQANPPEQISLGNDTTLCTGEELMLSLDPALGDFLWQDMSTLPSYHVTMTGTYFVTITNSCGFVFDTIEVEYLADPVVTFPADTITACMGDIIEFSFDPGQGQYAWQDGATGPDYEVDEEGLYSVTVMNACASDFAEVYVAFLSEPELDLGEDITICPAQIPLIIDLFNVPYAETYLWQDGSQDVVYQVQESGVYSVTVSNACFSVEDIVEVTVEDEAPQVDLPVDMKLCPGETLFLDVSDIPGFYTWQNGSQDPIFEVLESGTYSVTVSNLCGSGMDSIAVEYITPLPDLDLGFDIGICPGEEILLQLDIPDVSFIWQDGSTGNVFVISTPDTIILTIWNDCNEVSDTLVAFLDGTPPALNLPDTIALCAGGMIEIDAMVSGVSYAWNTGDTTHTLQITSAGTYALTVSNICGIATDTVVVLDAGLAPVVNLGADVALCPGDTVTVNLSAGNNSIIWNDGSTDTTYVIASPGVVSVEVSNSCGSATDTIVVTMLSPTPQAYLGMDTTLCPGESLLLQPALTGVAYLWNDGSMNSAFFVSMPGVVSLEVSDVCGTSTDSLYVGYFPDAPMLDLGADAALCPGDSITLSPGITGVTYLWQDGSSAPDFTATQSGLVYVTLEGDCWQISDTIEIFEDNDGPMIDLGDDITLCVGETAMINVGIVGVNYLWQDGSTGSSFLATTTGAVVLEVSNTCGSARDTILITVEGSAPAVTLGSDTTLCTGTTLILQADTMGLTTLTWQDGSNMPTYIVYTPGIYSLTATNMCGISTDSIYITGLSAPPNFSLGEDTTLCIGEGLILHAPSTNNPLLWSDGSPDSELVVFSGEVWLEISNFCGSARDTIFIMSNADMLQIDLDPSYQICLGESIALDVSQQFAAQYIWSTGDTLSQIQLQTPGIYSITISSACDNIEASVEIFVDDCSDPVHVFIPNVFSPNGDNINDVLFLNTNLPERILDFQVSVYDRWGNILYNSDDVSSGWDGSFRGSPMDPGVYTYVIEWTDTKQPTIPHVEYGDVTLVR